MIAFVGSGVMARLISSLVTVPYAGGRAPVQRVIYEVAFASWLAPNDASLAFAVAFVLVWYLTLRAPERRGIAFRV